MEALPIVQSYNSPIVQIGNTSQLLTLSEAPYALREAIIGRQEQESFTVLIDGQQIEVKILLADGSAQAHAAADQSRFLDDRWVLPRTDFREQY